MTDKSIYMTPNNHMLLWNRLPLECPVVTLENYEKWYEIFIVTPNGQVEAVPVETIRAVMDKYHDTHWVDHCYHPRLLYRLAKHLGGCVDPIAVEVAIGRWLIQRTDDESNFHDPALTEEEVG